MSYLMSIVVIFLGMKSDLIPVFLHTALSSLWKELIHVRHVLSVASLSSHLRDLTPPLAFGAHLLE